MVLLGIEEVRTRSNITVNSGPFHTYLSYISLRGNIRRLLVWVSTSGRTPQKGEKKIPQKTPKPLVLCKEKFAIYTPTRYSYHYNVGGQVPVFDMPTVSPSVLF